MIPVGKLLTTFSLLVRFECIESFSTVAKSLSSSSSQQQRTTRSISAKPFGADDSTDPRHQAIQSALLQIGEIERQESLASFFEGMDKIVETRPSLIAGAGMGLFAKKNIKSGTIVSFYPVHAIGVDFGDASVCLASDNVRQDYFGGNNDGEGDWNGSYLQYIIGSRPLAGRCVAELFDGDALFIDVDPNRVDRVGWKGHYVNDGAVVEACEEAGILQYYQRSRLLKNCVHVPFGPCPMLAVVATRKVKKGEELFTTYGGSYWLEKLMPGMDVDVTDAIRQEGLGVAKDIFISMQSIALTYEREAGRLSS
jgi:SET domain